MNRGKIEYRWMKLQDQRNIEGHEEESKIGRNYELDDK